MLVCCGLAAALPIAAAATTCHLHPPADAPTDEQEASPRLIGPFARVADCEAERQQRFGPLGRCHCRAAFSPDWPELGRPGGRLDGPSGAEPALP